MTMRRLARLGLGGALLTEAGMALHRFEARRRAFFRLAAMHCSSGPAGKGANCTAQVDVDCTEDVWGVENGTCYAMAPAQPECDGDGACVVPACGEQGDAIVSCPECMLSENTCVPGVKTNEIEVGGFCQTSGETPACESVCRGDALLQRSCAQDGHCQESMDSCAPYVCEAGGCLSSCNTDLDCSGTANCVDGVCE